MMVVAVDTPLGRYTLTDPDVEDSALFGPMLTGFYAVEGELWPQDYGPVRLDNCESWEIL